MKIGEMKESKYLRKEDVGQGRLFTIQSLIQENVAMDKQPEELKWVMYFEEEEKGIVLNWTNIQLAAQATGSEETETWIGKKIVLYADPNVSFGGKLVGGIRIRAAKQAARKTGEQTKPTEGEDIPFFKCSQDYPERSE